MWIVLAPERRMKIEDTRSKAEQGRDAGIADLFRLRRKRQIGQDTNQRFAADDTSFIEWCALAGVSATKRQASKFRNQKGAAFNAKQS